MTEIYLREKKKKGCLITVILAVLIAAGAAAYLKLAKPASPKPPPAPATQAVVEVSAPDQSMQDVEMVRQLKGDGKFPEARVKAIEILDKATNGLALAEAETLLGGINVELVRAPYMIPEKVEHVVQAGDSLVKLAKKYGTTVDLIMKSNNLSGQTIHAGDRLRILNAPFIIEVSKSRNDLVVYMGDHVFKRYRVGTGQYSKTPTGSFKIVDKIQQPTWWRADGKAIPYGDTNNVLGTHWMSLDIPGYGIHGTWEPDTIGKQASAGCIRMHNEDVAELFMLVPEGTPVIISE